MSLPYPIEDVLAGQAILRGRHSPLECFQIDTDHTCPIVTEVVGANETLQVVGGEELGFVIVTTFSSHAGSDVTIKKVSVPSAQTRGFSNWSSGWSLGGVSSISDATVPANISVDESPYLACLALLNARRGLLEPEKFAALSRQLYALRGEVPSEISGRTEIAISPTSLDGLIQFLSRHRPAMHPNISLSSDGRFVASWSRSRMSKIVLTFDQYGGDWVAMNLESKPRARASGAFVINSLAGIAPEYRGWIAA